MDQTDLEHRRALMSALMARLEQDQRVERVEPFGSMADDPDIPDEFSDIDLDVFLADSVSDLEFAQSVRPLLADFAPVRAARSLWLRDFAYVECVWFKGWPPYWHVDVRVRGRSHHADEVGQAP